MDGSGQQRGRRVRRLPFTPAAGVTGSVEVVDARSLFGPGRSPVRSGTHRAGFHTMLLITHGFGVHDVDFERFRYSPGTLLWSRPGTVQRFHAAEQTRGVAVLFTPDAPAPAPQVDALMRPSARLERWRLTSAETTGLKRFARLLRDLTDPGARAHVLSGLLLEVDHLDPEPRGGASPDDEVFRAFEVIVEQRYRARLTARQAAAVLGWSPRTLTRAVQHADGRNPKAFIDDRVLLEARRSLAFTDQAVTAIAADLGFSDPSAFGRFFQRLTGTSPGRWRADHAG